MIKDPIGKKVNLLVEKGNSCVIDKTKSYEIVGVKSYDETNDWCLHYVIKDEEGNESEVREVVCVFCPDYSMDEDLMIAKYLSDNSCYGEVSGNGRHIIVEISWGDWKHDHIWCENLMSYLGYNTIYEAVTEENGSDCYSAVHYFVKEEV